ncbi:Rieske (2Fe-2S) protein [Natronorubrum daqingense]|uniref:(2Fe-2S)-binding protein n=1 Tax=Natronorubrum daqingense TaxID=588898 RepID=A0A1N6YXN4_9EURY|nr:Rieske 2Fe-2S domain-containing protein [Natronorubrum daqingense]APX95535.1 (2Fe-2S)-binding protein [Natronorubrum daqingense]SIR19209.1 Rieske [2Fe-2S] domain-containing protein [Natronorubrum daqingense]
MDGAIVALEDIPTDSTVLFRVTDGEDEREAILVTNGDAGDGDGEIDGHSEDGRDGENDGNSADDSRAEPHVTCWLNYCQHLTHIKIDKGSGAPMRDGELVCANHGAYFDTTSGECTYGPCEGAYLTELEVSVSDGTVYLTDDEYAFVGDGPIDDDDDLTSTSNVKM